MFVKWVLVVLSLQVAWEEIVLSCGENAILLLLNRCVIVFAILHTEPISFLILDDEALSVEFRVIIELIRHLTVMPIRGREEIRVLLMLLEDIGCFTNRP